MSKFKQGDRVRVFSNLSTSHYGVVVGMCGTMQASDIVSLDNYTGGWSYGAGTPPSCLYMGKKELEFVSFGIVDGL
jgi:hypothetical protein